MTAFFSLLKTAAYKIESINEKIGNAVAWLSFVLVMLVCYDVISRYVFNSSFVAVQEMEWHLFAILFLMGATYTLKHDKHVRVDLIYSRLSAKTQAIINLAGVLLFLIPFAIVVIITSIDFVSNSFMVKESSPDPGGLPARYLIKSILPISFILLLFQSLVLLIRSLLTIKEGDDN